MAQLVKNPPAMRETWVQSLGWEDLLEKGTATHSKILAWRIPRTAQSMGSQSWTTFTFTESDYADINFGETAGSEITKGVRTHF